jgi:hypothetical protein
VIIPILAVVLVTLSAAKGGADDSARLTRLAQAILDADYRGDRADLLRLAAQAGAVNAPPLRAYGQYWQAFARWRRAINGFNETPTPGDLKDDVEAAIASFRGALAAKPGWIEAKIGLSGAAANLMYLTAGDAKRNAEVVAEFVPMFREMAAEGADNPRALWIVGGSQLGAPPPYGGDAARAAATFHKGVQAALREARQVPAPPAYAPAWGGAENLMNLAYLHSHSSLNDKALARAYAEGALVAAPRWHYVADILLPQIDALADAKKE